MNLEQRFWGKVQKSDGCWEWTGARAKSGYGVVNVDGRADVVHRVSWMLNRGEIGPGLFVCHTCDNRRCVRPDHLFLGTHEDNMRDASRKGRMHARLSPDEIDRAMAMVRSGLTKVDVARMFGVTPQAIGYHARRHGGKRA